jgi:uncharacterized protein (DUF2249 family)
MNDRTITLDVREDLRQGRAPFGRILAAAEALRADETLRLIAPIEPVPLLAVLRGKGFAHTAQQLAGGDWEVLFTRTPGSQGEAAPSAGGSSVTAPATVEVDVDARGLEPPEPMVRILEAVAMLPPGVTLRARTDRRPLHLLAELTARGFTHRSEEQADGSFVTHIAQA